MGISSRKPLLPAPTESLIESTAEETGVSEDIATDLSRRTDRTSATIPDDGSPVTITTAHKIQAHKLAKTSNPSQTSLLIEYYEGTKDPASGRRPSLRVRVRPSAGAKSKELKGDGHLVVTQHQGSRKTSYSRRIPLNSKSLDAHDEAESVSSLEDLEVTPRGPGPIDIEIGGQGSDMSRMSASPEPRYNALDSDISSMPADSMLGPRAPEIRFAPAAASSILSQSEVHGNSDLKPPIFPKERNASHERITQKAIEKLSSRERPSKSSRHHSSKSQNRSTDGQSIRVPSERRRKSSINEYTEESTLSTNTDPSHIDNSLVSAGGRSADQQSVRSGVSDIKNPKLLQMVEDTIRRLILPELKEIKRNGSQRTRHTQEETYSDISENSIAREKGTSRRVSSGGDSRRRVRKVHDASSSRRDKLHSQDADYDSISEISSPQRDSLSSTSDRHHRSRDKDHRTRDVAAGTLAGTALTAAALHHQASSSTLERQKRRKRSKSRSSRSRSASVNESEELFDKHDVPPMPFRSEVGSEMTRSSLLSSNTAGTATPTQREVREVIRGSPLDNHSPSAHTPTRPSGNLRQTLGTHHQNFSEHDLSMGRPSYEEQTEIPDSPEARGYSPEVEREQSLSTGLLADPERLKLYERNLHQQHPIRRGLSPIQSVASYTTTEPRRNSMMQSRSIDSIASMKKRQQALREEVSIDSFSSASPGLHKQTRPQGVNLEHRNEIMQQHDRGFEDLDEEDEEFYDEQHFQNDRYRDSYASSDLKSDTRRLTNYTDDSMDTPHLDKIAAGQQVAKGFASNPEYVHTPIGVESAVASLIEPSVLDATGSPHHSVAESHHDNTSIHSMSRDIGITKSGSPLKQEAALESQTSIARNKMVNSSPPQSPAHSFDENQHDVLHVATNEAKDANSPQSEITTNPSVIQGPIGGGLSSTNRDHWPYAPTPDRTTPNFPAQQALTRDLAMHAPDLIPEALNVSQRNNMMAKPEAYGVVESNPNSPHIKDEGYATGDSPRSPGLYAKHNETSYTPDNVNLQQDDPFVSKRDQYISGLSQGMSPLYDAATGKGVDRIQSKDIVALMDHLTVRDAQRNARDTEILITLVRSAAEMRNSFEDMKKFIAEQDGIIMDVAEEQHERTQKVIGGPRPQPASKTQQRSVTSPDDTPNKRRNIFKRALQGLGSKNQTELHNIEQMLMQLLDDVEGLRMVQTGQPGSLAPGAEHGRSTSLNSAENPRALTDPGYEPEGLAGTSSTGGDRSGFFSGNSSRQTDHRVASGRRQSSNRVSTVMEGDEEDYHDYNDGNQAEEHTPRASPAAEDRDRYSRDLSAPHDTPPKMHDRLSGPWVDDGNPHYTGEPTSAGRKHKSIASSIFGKGFMSRWSKTTASTAQDTRYSSQTKNRPYSQVSRSGSDFAGFAYEPHPDDRLRSNTSLENEQYRDQENRPPSPLVPSQVSENPKYQGYRNSQNLQHPQPRQGPTGRYQYRLENEAIAYNDEFSPGSQTSGHWEAQHAAANNPKDQHNVPQYVPQAPLSPISDGGYSDMTSRSASSSKRGPPRPPKVLDDEPLVPQRSSQGPMTPSNYVDHVTAARGGSPAYDKSPMNALRSPQGSARKPSGPRPLSSTGQNGKPVHGDINTVKKTRFRGSPYHIEN